MVILQVHNLIQYSAIENLFIHLILRLLLTWVSQNHFQIFLEISSLSHILIPQKQMVIVNEIKIELFEFPWDE